MFWVTVTVFENSCSRSVSYSAGFTKSAVMNWRDATAVLRHHPSPAFRALDRLLPGQI